MGNINKYLVLVRIAIAEVMQSASRDDFIIHNDWSKMFNDSSWSKLSKALENEFIDFEDASEWFEMENIKDFTKAEEIAKYVQGKINELPPFKQPLKKAHSG